MEWHGTVFEPHVFPVRCVRPAADFQQTNNRNFDSIIINAKLVKILSNGSERQKVEHSERERDVNLVLSWEFWQINRETSWVNGFAMCAVRARDRNVNATLFGVRMDCAVNCSIFTFAISRPHFDGYEMKCANRNMSNNTQMKLNPFKLQRNIHLWNQSLMGLHTRCRCSLERMWMWLILRNHSWSWSWYGNRCKCIQFGSRSVDNGSELHLHSNEYSNRIAVDFAVHLHLMHLQWEYFHNFSLCSWKRRCGRESEWFDIYHMNSTLSCKW